MNAVPVATRSCTVPLNNKTINAKRNHFPVVSSCAVTSHKEHLLMKLLNMKKTHSQPLVYVA